MKPYHAEVGREPCEKCGSIYVNKYDGRCIRCSRDRHAVGQPLRSKIDDKALDRQLHETIKEVWEE